MYHVQQRDFGYILTLSGTVGPQELKGWYRTSCNHLKGRCGPFGVLVDARQCHPLPKVARFWLLRGQQACEEAGLARAAVLVDSAAQEGYWPGLMSVDNPAHRVRFIDAVRRYPRVRALSWILKQVEPNLNEGSVAATRRSAPPVTSRQLIRTVA
jgi:hypothetical protein